MLGAVHVHLDSDIETIFVIAFAGLVGSGIAWLVKQQLTAAKLNKVVHEFVTGRAEVRSSDGKIIQPGSLPARAQMDALVAGQEKISGELDAVKAHVAKVDLHLTTQDATIERVEHEVLENDGSSVKDTANRTEAAVKELSKALSSVSDRLDAHMVASGDKGDG